MSTPKNSSQLFATRLRPGQDLRLELQRFAKDRGLKAASIVSGVGSLKEVTIRFADRPEGKLLKGPFEIVSLTGTVSSEGCHVHIAVADKEGHTLGGHLMDGSWVYTTVELTLLDATNLRFSRELDPETTYKELIIKEM